MLLRQLVKLTETTHQLDPKAPKLPPGKPYGKNGILYRGVSVIRPDHLWDFLEAYIEYLEDTPVMDDDEDGRQYNSNKTMANAVRKIFKRLKDCYDDYERSYEPREGKYFAFAVTDDYDDSSKYFRRDLKELIGENHRDKFKDCVMYTTNRYNEVSLVGYIPDYYHGDGYVDWDNLGEHYMFWKVTVDE